MEYQLEGLNWIGRELEYKRRFYEELFREVMVDPAAQKDTVRLITEKEIKLEDVRIAGGQLIGCVSSGHQKCFLGAIICESYSEMAISPFNEALTSGRLDFKIVMFDREEDIGVDQFPDFPGKLVTYSPNSDMFKEVNGGSAYWTTTEMNSVCGTYDRKTIFKQMILSHCVAVEVSRNGGDKGRPSKKHKYSAKEDVRSRVIDDEDEYYHEDSVEDNREGKKNDFTKLELKPDHVNRPMWAYADGQIFLEMFSSLYKQAYDFLIAIAEPVCRPETMHEYNLTPHSLYVAVSVGLETCYCFEQIIENKVTQGDDCFIYASTANYGKVKLVLKKNRYFVESSFPEALKILLRDDVISRARISSEGLHANDSFTISKKLEEVEGRHDELLNEIDVAAAAEEKESHALEIEPAQVENVKQRCWPKALIYPMLEEYDFRNDMVNPDLKIELLPKAQPRPYQEKSMSKMFGNGRARSGIIVLPCGARKSLVGVSAACRIRKSCLCLTTNAVSVDQWTFQFRQWSSIREDQINKFTFDSKERFHGNASVVVTTYNMVAFGGKWSEESEKIIEEKKKNREWGLLLMDEMHVVPADMFRKVISITKSHCKLGLTATLVREDECITNLNFLIGPKLYEANWLDLVKGGFIANIQCAEVWCPMTKEFFAEYFKKDNSKRKHAIYVMNPK
ncbi:hypothetical protein GIB67_042566 [Kingdonia uniflora]|uniref:DNA 3'-5' helicase n=1 Tax=Kingdonia uniflora TaxID=39325 RepID=A0A7J7M179_9MAGN|nr:hypothetical protein GIB67_042566 [Kingdonia uniflora]